jgi:uncharacterized protein (DUF1697 family)
MKFIALLRGINVGGNNKVPMTQLKACFEAIGFSNVQTYINSGNVIFDSDRVNKATLVNMCEEAIEKKFGFRVICSVITAEELQKAVREAPAWWDSDDTVKHNAIFVIAPATAKDIMKEVGEAKPEYEKIAVCEPVIFWSAPLETFGRTRYSKIVSTKSYTSVTIRNANTTRKLAELTKQQGV